MTVSNSGRQLLLRPSSKRSLIPARLLAEFYSDGRGWIEISALPVRRVQRLCRYFFNART